MRISGKLIEITATGDEVEVQVKRKNGEVNTPVTLKFDTYALDRVSRAQVVSKLVQAGVDIATALAAVRLGQTTHQMAFTSQPPISKPFFSPDP